MPKRRPPIADIRARIVAGEYEDRDLRRWARDPRIGVKSLAKIGRRHRRAAKAELERLEALLEHERRMWHDGLRHIAGIDEVGSGPLAGPVVAAAVVLPVGCSINGIDDSKALTRSQRERLDIEIRTRAVAYSLASCNVEEIDRWNILQAGREAMRRAVAALSNAPDHLLVDARTIPDTRIPQTSIIGGDSVSQSIAAASIVAKVARDAQMAAYAEEFPGYGFERHRGYATRAHLEALEKLGPSPIHRRSFAPVSSAEHASA